MVSQCWSQRLCCGHLMFLCSSCRVVNADLSCIKKFTVNENSQSSILRTAAHSSLGHPINSLVLITPET